MRAESNGKLFDDACVIYAKIEKEPCQKFSDKRSAHLSSFIKSSVSQDILMGLADIEESVKSDYLSRRSYDSRPSKLRRKV